MNLSLITDFDLYYSGLLSNKVANQINVGKEKPLN